MPNEIILYGLKQTGSRSGITYYRNFRDYTWVEKVNEKCLLTEEWLVKEIQHQLTGHSEIITFSLKEKKLTKRAEKKENANGNGR